MQRYVRYRKPTYRIPFLYQIGSAASVDAASMDSHVGLDYIVDNPDYCVKLASGNLLDVPDFIILQDYITY